MIQSGQYKSYCNRKLKRIATDKERKEKNNRTDGETKERMTFNTEIQIYKEIKKYSEIRMGRRKKERPSKHLHQEKWDLSVEGFLDVTI